MMMMMMRMKKMKTYIYIYYTMKNSQNDFRQNDFRQQTFVLLLLLIYPKPSERLTLQQCWHEPVMPTVRF